MPGSPGIYAGALVAGNLPKELLTVLSVSGCEGFYPFGVYTLVTTRLLGSGRDIDTGVSVHLTNGG